ncbi:MAG: hypothetical protein WC785_03480 [Tatlockia sp.]|jgi:cholesterol transport system auxiliary component
MRKTALLFLVSLLLIGCSAVKTPVSNQYKLTAYSQQQFAKSPIQRSILVTLPEAVAGYQTEEMLYMKKPFELTAFANNAWVDQPANMLFPLIVQSIQRSGYFYAVASSPHAELTDYRLDTQLIELQQNFLKNPSVISLVVKVVLTDMRDNHVIASRLISEHICSPSASPYGGVVAANRAAELFTAETTRFVIAEARKNTHSK